MAQCNYHYNQFSKLLFPTCINVLGHPNVSECNLISCPCFEAMVGNDDIKKTEYLYCCIDCDGEKIVVGIFNIFEFEIWPIGHSAIVFDMCTFIRKIK